MVPSGVVAMDRHYFQNTGAYDPLMSLRGGENLELSLKVCPGPREEPDGFCGVVCEVPAEMQPLEMPLVRDKAAGNVSSHEM